MHGVLKTLNSTARGVTGASSLLASPLTLLLLELHFSRGVGIIYHLACGGWFLDL